MREWDGALLTVASPPPLPQASRRRDTRKVQGLIRVEKNPNKHVTPPPGKLVTYIVGGWGAFL